MPRKPQPRRRTPSWGPPRKVWYKRMFTFERIMYVVLTLFIICGVVAAVGIGLSERGPENTDPRHGRVELPGYDNYKFCDGTTLVYHLEDGGGSIISESPECAA